jgi:thymidylate synthase
MQYSPVCKPNQLICGEGRIVIVSGWTQAKFIEQQLDRTDYAAIGQLYSPTRGISFLFRNLLVNPHVYAIVGINATSADTNAGSVKALVDFFNNGFERGQSDTGRECWVIKSEKVGYIDIEIPESALELLRKSISCGEVFSVSEAIEYIKLLVASIASAEKFSDGTAMKPWAEPMTFPIPEIESIVFPGQRYGHRIEGATIAETWVKLLHRIRTTGTLRPTGYDGQWQELIDLMAIVTDEPPDFYFPEPNFLPLDRPFLESYIPRSSTTLIIERV